MKMIAHCFAVSILLVAAGFGCSQKSGPSAAEGERGILEAIKQQSRGCIKLVSVQKTNGQKGESMGIAFYKMEFDAVIEFTEDCRWWKDDMRGCFMTAPSAKDAGDMAVKRGQSFKLKGSIGFEQTEKGWRVKEIELSQQTPVGGPPTPVLGNAPQDTDNTAITARQLEMLRNRTEKVRSTK